MQCASSTASSETPVPLQSLRRTADVEALRRDVEQLELAALRARQSIGDLRRTCSELLTNVAGRPRRVSAST